MTVAGLFDVAAPVVLGCGGRRPACTTVVRLLLSGLIALATLNLPEYAIAAEAGDINARDQVTDHIATASRRFGIPEAWMRAVIDVESAGNVHAMSSKGAMGLMQITPGTWTDLSDRFALGTDPFDPRDNIMAGTAYLRMMHDRFGSPGFLAAYNAGPRRFEQFLFEGRPLPQETINYVQTLAPMIGISAASVAQLAPGTEHDWRDSPLFVAQPNRTPIGGGPAFDDPNRDQIPSHRQPETEPFGRPANGLFVRPRDGNDRQ